MLKPCGAKALVNSRVINYTWGYPYLPSDQMITTIFATPDNPTGLMDEALFVKTEGVLDNDNEYTTFVEYRDGTGQIVHRSVDIKLKKWPDGMEAMAGVLA